MTVMAGSVHKRVSSGGKITWQAKLRLPDGKWRTATFRLEREAKAALLAWQGEDYLPDSVETIGGYLLHWLDTVKRHTVKPSTYRSYRWQVRTQIIPTLGNVKLQEFTVPQAQRWLSGQKDREYTRERDGVATTRPVSARMVRYSYSLLRAALADARDAGLVKTNVLDTVTPPRKAAQQHHTWSEEQVQGFLAAAATRGYHPLWLLLLTTGMRIGELLALRWSDVDLSSGAVQVCQNLALWEDGRHMDTPKSDAGTRTLTLGDASRTALRAHRSAQNEQKLRKGAAWQEYGIVFASQVGTPLNPANVRTVYLQIIAQAGLPHIRIHDLRHTNATIAVQNGVPMHTVSERLGHADVRTTMSIYVRSRASEESRAAETIEALITRQKA